MVLVAWYELKEMLHTRRALVLISIYLLGGMVAARGFVAALGEIEDVAADVLETGHTEKPGTLTQKVLQSEEYRRKLTRHFPDKETADFLLGLQPIVLFYAWVTMTFLPFLIVFTSADVISQEVQDRGIRYLAYRTGRLEVVFGKYLGQAMLLGVVVLTTGLVFVGVGAVYMSGFQVGQALLGVLLFWPRLLAYGLAFLGLVGLFSMNARSATVARAVSFIGLVLAWILGAYAHRWQDAIYGPAWTFIGFLLPFSHRGAMWRPRLFDVAQEAAVLLALALLYLGLGMVWFRRKDL